jgi:hypothetical protein
VRRHRTPTAPTPHGDRRLQRWDPGAAAVPLVRWVLTERPVGRSTAGGGLTHPYARALGPGPQFGGGLDHGAGGGVVAPGLLDQAHSAFTQSSRECLDQLRPPTPPSTPSRRAGCTARWCWTCARGVWRGGRAVPHLPPLWQRMRSGWPSTAVEQRRAEARGNSGEKYQLPCPRRDSAGHRTSPASPLPAPRHPHRLHTEPEPDLTNTPGTGLPERGQEQPVCGAEVVEPLPQPS